MADDHAAAPDVRHRCRLRDCAADWRCVDGRTTEPQRRGLGHPEHISAGRVRRSASPSSALCSSPHSAQGTTARWPILAYRRAQRVQLVDAVKDSAGAAIPGLAANPGTAAVAEPARVAFTDASRVAALTAAGFLVIGLVASLSLGNPRRRRSIDGSADQSEPVDATAYPASWRRP